MNDHPELPPFEDPRRVLARHGLRPKRRMSQNFLVARPIVERIAAAAAEPASVPLIELGPGLGTLTVELLRRGARVVAIERDADMRDVLEQELGPLQAFEVREGDATTVDLRALAAELGSPRVRVVGNLPYAVTGAIMRNLVDQRDHVDRAVVMIQREVRDRLLAPAGTKDYGALTVFVTSQFRVEPVCLVSPGCFHPPPKVASAVVALVPHPEPRAELTPAFERVVRASFEARRKTLRKALQRVADVEAVQAALEAVDIDSSRRGETLSVEQFARLAAALG